MLFNPKVLESEEMKVNQALLTLCLSLPALLITRPAAVLL